MSDVVHRGPWSRQTPLAPTPRVSDQWPSDGAEVMVPTAHEFLYCWTRSSESALICGQVVTGRRSVKLRCSIRWGRRCRCGSGLGLDHSLPARLGADAKFRFRRAGPPMLRKSEPGFDHRVLGRPWRMEVRHATGMPVGRQGVGIRPPSPSAACSDVARPLCPGRRTGFRARSRATLYATRRLQ